MSTLVFVEQLTQDQARAGTSPTVVRIEGRGSAKELRLPGDEYLKAKEARRLARWILARFPEH